MILSPIIMNCLLYRWFAMGKYISLGFVAILSAMGGAIWMLISFSWLSQSWESLHTLSNSIGQCVFIYTLFLIYDIIYTRYMEEKDTKKYIALNQSRASWIEFWIN